MKRIIQKENGNISVIHPAPKSRLENETEAEWLDRVFTRATPDGAVFSDVDDAQIPSDRSFRNAWEIKDKKVNTNFLKAQGITKERLRAERTPLLKELDIDYMRAVEQGIDTADIISEKERLRDITLMADTTTTLDNLKNLNCVKADIQIEK